MVTGVASITDEWALLELGFRLLQRKLRERGRTTAPRAYPHRRYSIYRRQRAAVFIQVIESPAVDQTSSSQPRSCLRKTMTMLPIRSSKLSGLGRFGPALVGCGQVSLPPTFFSLSFLYFQILFSFLI
jgi:hypothetical protein